MPKFKGIHEISSELFKDVVILLSPNPVQWEPLA